ncbi:hypothetical protein AYO20_00632 [Fonsecaea nubica]|uniref:Protein kinase domain-containing protein n=1 Tax=Fonsecaea nubica TaxID=856822 RepID=A0A178DEV5_9EURO|nr:hypothetical protein AYO20_00632 [Fonsecaea nubica]OAL40212.1 hypothetical protein AYO20_00632 [Fonsecaea nubica]
MASYDLLALLTASIAGMPDNPSAEEELLSQICIEKTSFPQEEALGFGGSFNAIAVPPNRLRRCVDSRNLNSDPLLYLGRNKYIIRSPKAALDMRSMATELAVLRSDSIRKHANIIELLGLAWEVTNATKERILPVFVLEYAELGDLESFLRDDPATLVEQLALAIGVAEGLRALHDVGVVHCDMKPANILLCLDRHGKPVAKLSDFSSSVLLSDLPRGSTYPIAPGTELWQSPWATRECTAQQLVRSDVYAFGLILAVLITRIRPDILEHLTKTGSGGRHLDELKTSGDLGDAMADFAVMAENTMPAGETEHTMHLKRITLIYALSTQAPFVECTSGALDILKILRLLLHLVVAMELREKTRNLSSLTSLEENVIANPTIDPASEIDDAIEMTMREAESDMWRVTDNAVADPTGTSEGNRRESLSDSASERSFPDEQELLPDPSDAEGSSSQQGIDDTLENASFFNRLESMARLRQSDEQVLRTYTHEAVISHVTSFKRLRNLPSRVFSAVLQELETVASDKKSQDDSRRATAAYEFAGLTVGRHQISPLARDEDLRKATDLLLQAAQLGHSLARASVGMIVEGLELQLEDLNRDTEIEWLQDLIVRGKEEGESLAKQRLRKLDGAKYEDAVRMSRVFYRNTWSSLILGLLMEDGADIMKVFGALELGSSEHWMFCQHAILFGKNEMLKQALPSLGKPLNEPMVKGRTLLLEACYAGNVEAVMLCIAAGADVKVPLQADGTTALHLLSMFPDEKVSEVAEKLKDAGADIEARCWLSRSRPGCIDLQDAVFYATPLLSAVVAGSVTAVQGLVRLGADPFDQMETMTKLDRQLLIARGGRLYSPVHYAARLHMIQVLRALLPDDRRYEELSSVIRYDEPFFWVLPIWCALDYSASGIWQRLCLHGKEHVQHCVDTVEFLYTRGSKNSKTCEHRMGLYSRYSFDASCHLGQPFLMRRLWAVIRGQLQPPIQELAKIMQRAIDFEDRATVHQLVPLLEATLQNHPEHEGFKFKASIQGHKPAEVVDYFIKLDQKFKSTPTSRISLELVRDQKESLLIGPDQYGPAAVPRSQGGIRVSIAIRPGRDGRQEWTFKSAEPVGVPKGEILPEKSDAGEKISLFESAVLGGYFHRARELYKSPNDLICRRDEKDRGKSTLLGRLIRDSKIYKASEAQTLFLLSLVPDGSDELFENVLEGEEEGSSLTALHAAVFYLEPSHAQRGRTALPVLDAIVGLWPESDHLERLTSDTKDGTTALHIAVESGNLDALRYIAREAEGPLNWNVLNGKGETPLDIALVQSLGAEDVLAATGITPEHSKWQERVEKHYSDFGQIRSLLKDNGAKYNSIGAFVCRESEDSWTMHILNRLDLSTTPAAMYDSLFGGESEHLHRSADGEVIMVLTGAQAARVLGERMPNVASMDVGDHVFLPVVPDLTAMVGEGPGGRSVSKS